MTIRIAVVDLSALPRWPAQALASRDVHEAVDRYWALRTFLSTALGPSPFQLLRFGPALLGVVHVE